ncbi:hypothetical protein ACHAW6_002066, partial [Cyclotella cf. meneghiniana]
MLEHRLSCTKEGLVRIHHNGMHKEYAQLCSITLIDSRVVIKPTIFYG